VNRALLSFVVPVALADTGREGSDLERLSLFLDTFLHFFDRRDLADFLVVARPQDVAALERLVARKGMSGIARVLDENDIVPELRSDPPTEHVWPRPNKGWHRQQIIKLACHAHVSTEFYMAADSDILFVKPFGAATLIEDGRAILNVQTRGELEKIYATIGMKYEVGFHTMGHGQARKLLGMSRSYRRTYSYYGYSPVVLSRSIVASMTEHLSRRHGQNWREVLISQLPWTEYGLYFTFAEATGALDKFHRIGGLDSVLRVTDSVLWPSDYYKEPRTLENWTLGSLESPPEGIAVGVQSHLGYGPAAVRAAAGRLLGESVFDGAPRREPCGAN
jgi:hypothetical protein